DRRPLRPSRAHAPDPAQRRCGADRSRLGACGQGAPGGAPRGPARGAGRDQRDRALSRRRACRLVHPGQPPGTEYLVLVRPARARGGARPGAAAGRGRGRRHAQSRRAADRRSHPHRTAQQPPAVRHNLVRPRRGPGPRLDQLRPGARPAAMTALRRATGLALLLTYALIVLGAWVRATASGLACPDWPTCYGHWVPLPGGIPPEAGYAYSQLLPEWADRPLAGVILGPLVLVIGWLAWRARQHNPRMPAYGAALVLLLLVQAGLGGVTVLDQNSPWSVALHLSTALLVLSVLCLIFARTGPAPDR